MIAATQLHLAIQDFHPRATGINFKGELGPQVHDVGPWSPDDKPACRRWHVRPQTSFDHLDGPVRLDIQ